MLDSKSRLEIDHLFICKQQKTGASEKDEVNTHKHTVQNLELARKKNEYPSDLE